MAISNHTGEGSSPSTEKLARAFPSFKNAVHKTGRVWNKTRRWVLALMLLLLVIHTALNIYGSVTLNRELAEIRGAGEPLSLAEAAPPAVPAAENAALVYAQATKALRLTDLEVRDLQDATGALAPLTPKQAAVLARNQTSIQLTRRAAALPACQFPIDWNKRPDVIAFPQYAATRRLARLLSIDAVQQARTGHQAVAMEDVRALFGMPRHFQQDPVLIGFLVARSLDAIANDALGRVLEVAPLTKAEAHAFEAALPPDDWSNAFRSAILGERTFGIWAFDFVRKDPRVAAQMTGSDAGNSPSWLSYPARWLLGPYLKCDEAYYLGYWRRNLVGTADFKKMPVPTTLAPPTENIPRYFLVSRVILPVFSRSRQMRDFVEVTNRERTIALALSAYRAANGHYPANLLQAQQLWGRSLPLDLYSGKPFHYRTRGQGFVLYSVGANRIDEGGDGLLLKPSVPRASFDGDIPWMRPDRRKSAVQ